MVRQYGAPDKDPKEKKSGQYEQRKDAPPKAKEEDPSPPTRAVEMFHKNAAVDSRPEDIHHTIGTTSSHAAAGDHTHNGGDSALLLEGFTITGSKSSPTTMWPSIIQCLVRLGAKDSTTG